MNWMQALTVLKSTRPRSLRSLDHDRAGAAIAFCAQPSLVLSNARPWRRYWRGFRGTK